jgi:16S rRNA (uracil1498-N3)-methyltransferase
VSVRAFTPSGRAPVEGAQLELDADESRYLAKVRRLRVGDSLELLDGVAGRWSAHLVELSARSARVEVGPRLEDPRPPERVLLLGFPDPTATATVLGSACELGIDEVVLVRCARSQGRLPSAERAARLLRAAQRQCGRARPPRLHGLDSGWTLERALAHRAELPGVFAWEALRGAEAGDSVSRLDRSSGLRLLVGPEGGLSEAEVSALEDAGFVPASLGPFVLRTTTAAIALAGRLLP